MLTVEDLAAVRTIDLTTFGRRTGLPRRIEIWWFVVDGRFIITGTPGPRDWLANVRSDPRVIVHVHGRDIHTTAAEISEESFRLRVFEQRDTRWYSTQAGLRHLVESAPMIEVKVAPVIGAV